MTLIRQGSSPSYDTPATGHHVCTAAATQIGGVDPGVPMFMGRIKAATANALPIAIGPSTVILPTGLDSVVAGFTLAPGEDSGWIPLANINNLWAIGGNATDSLEYWGWL